MSTIRAKNLSPASPRIFEKIRNGPDGIIRDPVETDSWKNLKLKITSQTPFTVTRIFFGFFKTLHVLYGEISCGFLISDDENI